MGVDQAVGAHAGKIPDRRAEANRLLIVARSFAGRARSYANIGTCTSKPFTGRARSYNDVSRPFRSGLRPRTLWRTLSKVFAGNARSYNGLSTHQGR